MQEQMGAVIKTGTKLALRIAILFETLTSTSQHMSRQQSAFSDEENDVAPSLNPLPIRESRDEEPPPAFQSFPGRVRGAMAAGRPPSEYPTNEPSMLLDTTTESLHMTQTVDDTSIHGANEAPARTDSSQRQRTSILSPLPSFTPFPVAPRPSRPRVESPTPPIAITEPVTATGQRITAPPAPRVPPGAGGSTPPVRIPR
ncbi:hypothetical protein FRC07_005786 [Ceratobasidium sp. 392]|nr:hypothetical protein FRC07_005786 [Ceratobasidium sp. 392]